MKTVTVSTKNTILLLIITIRFNEIVLQKNILIVINVWKPYKVIDNTMIQNHLLLNTNR